MPTKDPTAPTPKPAAATVASTAKTEERKTQEPATTETADDTCKNRALWIGGAVAAVAIAVGIPLLFRLCACEQEEEEEEEKKVASSATVLNKLVTWVKELRDGEREDEEKKDKEEEEHSKYVEVASVADFAKTQSM